MAGSIESASLAYMSGVDRALQDVPSPYAASPKEEIVYTLLSGKQCVLAAAAPFKRRDLWRFLEEYPLLVKTGFIRFALDSRHDGQIANYINSRIEKLTSVLTYTDLNHEYRSYTQGADAIVDALDYSDFTIQREIDCDSTLRKMVVADLKNESKVPGVSPSLSESFPAASSSEEFREWIRETALNRRSQFHLDIIQREADSFQISSDVKHKLVARLDELFGAANAQSISHKIEYGGSRFARTVPGLLREFCTNYRVFGRSLDSKLMSLNDEELLILLMHPHVELFAKMFFEKYEDWVSTYGSLRDAAMTIAATKHVRAKVRSGFGALIGGVFCEAAAFLLGMSFSVGFVTGSVTIETLLSLFPNLIERLERSPVYTFDNLVRERLKHRIN